MSRISRRLLKFASLFGMLMPVAAFAQIDALQGHCTLGGSKALVSGLSSTNYNEGIVPGCTVEVFLTGTTTHPTQIYSNASGSPLSNPFTAVQLPSPNAGYWIFFAATGQGYDVKLSGGGGNPSCNTAPNCYTVPLTYTDLKVGGSGGGGSGPTIQTKGTNNFSQTILNFTDPSTFNGLSFDWQNPSGGIETFGITGTLDNSGITNPFTTVNGVTCTLGSPCTLPPPTPITVQVEDSATGVNQNVIDFNSTTPTPPPGATNVKWQNDTATGRKSAYVPIPSSVPIQPLLVPPVSGQYVIVWPTTCTSPGPGVPGGSCFATGSSAGGALACSGGTPPCGPISDTWSTYVLPAGVTQAQITQVNVAAVSGIFGLSTFTAFSCTDGSINSGDLRSSVPFQQQNATFGGIPTVANISCTATIAASGALRPTGGGIKVGGPPLYVTYTGTPVAQPSSPSFSWPLVVSGQSVSLFTPFNAASDLTNTNNYAVTLPVMSTPFAIAGQDFWLTIANANTNGGVTLQLNGSPGSAAIRKVSGGSLVPLVANDMVPSVIGHLVFDGNVFELLNPATGSGGALAGSGTSGFFACWTASTTLANCFADYGVTLANFITFSKSIQVNDGSGNAGYVPMGGNTGTVTVPANTAGFMAPSSASFTAYALQLPATGPTSSNPFLSCGTPVSGVSPCTYVSGTSTIHVTIAGGLAVTQGTWSSSPSPNLGPLIPLTYAITIPSGCTNSAGIASVNATGTTAWTLVDATSSTTLCTFTFSSSSANAVVTGAGGTVAAGHALKYVGAATADATLIAGVSTDATH